VLFAKNNLNDRVKEDKMGKGCSIMGGNGNTHSVLVGKPEGKRSLRRLRHRWKNATKMMGVRAGSPGPGWRSMAGSHESNN
jgi:hypothetical protein